MSPYGVQAVARLTHRAFEKQRLLAVLIAYSDASGSPSDQDVYTVAMLIASEKRWKEFEAQWRKLLRRYKIPCMHMADFEAGVDPFNKLSGDTRSACSSEFWAIIENTIQLGIAHSIDIHDWRALALPSMTDAFERKRAHHVYVLQSVLEDIARRLRMPRHEKLAFVCDQDKFIEHASVEQYKRLKRIRGWDNIFDGMAFENKMDFVSLQAADMLAYEAFQYRRSLQANPPPKPRSAIQHLIACKKIHLSYLDIAALIRSLEIDSWMEVVLRDGA